MQVGLCCNSPAISCVCDAVAFLGLLQIAFQRVVVLVTITNVNKAKAMEAQSYSQRSLKKNSQLIDSCTRLVSMSSL